jgi:hypothetical protein
MAAKSTPSMESMVQLATHLSDIALRDVSVGVQEIRPVPLRQIARNLGVEVEVRERNSQTRSAGALWEQEREQMGLFGDFSADIAGTSKRSRFTLAHEIGHRLVDLYAPHAGSIHGKTLENLVDEIASRLLLPDSLLLNVLKREEMKTLPIKWIQQSHTLLGVSLTCLIKRLNNLCWEERVDITNCIFVVTPTVSAKSRTTYAPRIQALCIPKSIFIPVNKRVESLGMKSALATFWNAPLYKEGRFEDTFMFWRRDDWTIHQVRDIFAYVVYETVASSRLMLAVGSGQTS